MNRNLNSVIAGAILATGLILSPTAQAAEPRAKVASVSPVSSHYTRYNVTQKRYHWGFLVKRSYSRR